MSITDELERLERLKQNGSLTEEEYQKAKNTLLTRQASPSEKLNKFVDGISADENFWSMLIHVSQFCGYLVPLAGWIVPIVLWILKKDSSPYIDTNGKIVVNWIITQVIYGIVFGILCAVFIGLPLLLALLVVGVVFPILGAMKANRGEAWSYPLSIKFFPIA